MDDHSQQPIIIKKVKRGGHGGHHGGSWKVAYADFVTAMMAFFLLMWLLSMTSPEQKAQLSNYFTNFSVFQSSGVSSIKKPADIFDQPVEGVRMLIRNPGESEEGMSSEKLVKKLKRAVAEKLEAIQDQILIDIVEGGVRVQIVDAEGHMMFSLGSAEPTEEAKKILQLVSENIKGLNNRIAIEGHTDAAPFAGGQMTNWELSTARASAARRELERNGLVSERIARVVGYADQELYVKTDPRDPKNRRISIILIQPNTAETNLLENQPRQTSTTKDP